MSSKIILRSLISFKFEKFKSLKSIFDIKSKISEVIYSVADIDQRVRNKSFEILKFNIGFRSDSILSIWGKSGVNEKIS